MHPDVPAEARVVLNCRPGDASLAASNEMKGKGGATGAFKGDGG